MRKHFLLITFFLFGSTQIGAMETSVHYQLEASSSSSSDSESDSDDKGGYFSEKTNSSLKISHYPKTNQTMGMDKYQESESDIVLIDIYGEKKSGKEFELSLEDFFKKEAVKASKVFKKESIVKTVLRIDTADFLLLQSQRMDKEINCFREIVLLQKKEELLRKENKKLRSKKDKSNKKLESRKKEIVTLQNLILASAKKKNDQPEKTGFNTRDLVNTGCCMFGTALSIASILFTSCFSKGTHRPSGFTF